MRFATCLCFLLVVAVLVSAADARKTLSTRRKSGGNNRRGGSTNYKQKPPPAPAPVTPHKTDSTNTNFLNAERGGTSHGSTNTHYRGDPFNNKPPEAPKQPVPQTNGPVGFEKLNNQGNQKLGFDKVNSEVQHKSPSNVPSAPAYPAKPAASAPNGPPPPYPGYGSSGTGSHTGSYEPPPAYPGRPVNAPPVYSPNTPNYGQRNPAQPGVGGYPYQQSGFQQNGYPQQQGAYAGHNYPGQQNFGYPNTGSNFGSYPNQGYNQGFGSNPGGGFGGGYGQSYSGFGGNPYGGSPFGQSNSYGGSPFASSGFGGNSFGGYGNPSYSPNNFGFSSNPGFFGSQSGGYNNYGYHKKSRFGGLPIPIPIPIPIPLGMFGGFGGGRSYNHRVLDTFVKNKNISSSDNATTSVFILNNSTVTPCTTDQFIYASLNVTVVSCTAGNCTAIKVFTTTAIGDEVSVHSAGVTMCLEPNVTYSTHADNVNPTVSDVHRYWMKVCKEIIDVNSTGNITDQSSVNMTVRVSEVVVNETVVSEANTTTEPSPTSSTSAANVESTTAASVSENSTETSTPSNSSELNSTEANNSTTCEIFDCSWIEMCLPPIEIVDRCLTPECPFTRTGYQPCVRIKMCKSPSTPISTFATLNNTISRIDQFNNITSVNDLANLTLISYIPPTIAANCSQNVTDPNCPPPLLNLAQEVCAPSNSTEVADGGSPAPNNGTLCSPPLAPEGSTSTTTPKP